MELRLQCPLLYYHAVKSYLSSVECGYKTLAEQVDNISELAHKPLNVYIKQLDDGDGNEATLMRHHAGWVSIKFNQS